MRPPRRIRVQLLQTAGIRGISMGARSVTVLLAVRLLSPVDYGFYCLVQTTVLLATLVGTLNFPAYFIRALPGRVPIEQHAIFKHLMSGMLPANVLVAVAGAFAGPLFLPGRHLSSMVLISAIYLFEVVCLNAENFLLGCRELERANLFALLRNVGAASVLCVLVFQRVRTLDSVLVAWLFADAFALGACWRPGGWHLLRSASEHPPHLWRDAVRYSTPLLVGGLAFNIMRFGDRYVIAHYLGIGAIAPYDIAYKIVNIVYGLTVLVANTVLVPGIMAAENRGDTPARDRQILQATKLGVYALLLSVAFFAVLPAHVWVLITGHAQYTKASSLAVILGVAMIFSILGYPAHWLLLAKGKTGVAAIADTAGVCANLGLNVLLLPRMGIYGAAVSAALGLGASTAAKHVYARRKNLLVIERFVHWTDERTVIENALRSLTLQKLSSS